jgi:hypothetical protein
MRTERTALLIVAIFAIPAIFAMQAAGAPPNDKSSSGKRTVAATYGNSDSITEEEMRVYDYFLASDQLEGRNFPSRGYDTAALYIASHLVEWGIKPLGSTSGTNGPLQPYFMPIELISRQIVSEETKASITAPTPFRMPGATGAAPVRTTDYELNKDWSVSTYSAGFHGPAGPETIDVSGNLVFVGTGYVIPKANINPYEGLDVHGKIVVVAGTPKEVTEAQMAQMRSRNGEDPLGEPCKDYWRPDQAAAKNGAVALISLANFQQLGMMGLPNGGFPPSLNGPRYQVPKLQQPEACPTVPQITTGIGLTNGIFMGEKVGGSQIFYGAGNQAKQDSFALSAEKTIKLHIAGKNENGHGENVVGLLEGSDPVLKNEYVIISAHLDHVGIGAPMPNGHNVYNGADDDGSGSTGLLGVARAYAEGAAKGMRPKRSIVFLWNGGEEKGLWGSEYFAKYPPIDLSKAVANLNMDMIGRTKNPNSVDPDPTHVLVNSGQIMVVGPNVSSDDLKNTMETVNNNYQKLGLNYFYDATAPDATHDNLGPGPMGQGIFYRSDHYSFARLGMPIAFFFDGLHVDYHRMTDTPEKIDYKEIQQVSKTVSALCWVLANQAGRPQLKANLPAQLVKGMKEAKEQGWGKVTPVLPPLPGEPY